MVENETSVEYIDIKNLNSINPEKLFSDVTDEKVLSIFDVDGVLFRANNNNFISRMKVAKEIAKRSDKVVIDTARIVTRGKRETDIFPFISERFVNRMTKFLGGKEKVEFRVGLEKLRGCFDSNNEFYSKTLDMIQDGYNIYWFGSSKFDHEKAKRLAELANLNNLKTRKIYHYNTGFILI